jgi:hypothetical protein
MCPNSPARHCSRSPGRYPHDNRWKWVRKPTSFVCAGSCLFLTLIPGGGNLLHTRFATSCTFSCSCLCVGARLANTFAVMLGLWCSCALCRATEQAEWRRRGAPSLIQDICVDEERSEYSSAHQTPAPQRHHVHCSSIPIHPRLLPNLRCNMRHLVRPLLWHLSGLWFAKCVYTCTATQQLPARQRPLRLSLLHALRSPAGLTDCVLKGRLWSRTH